MQEKGRYNARNCCVNSYITKRSSEAPHLTELRLVIQLCNPAPVETKKESDGHAFIIKLKFCHVKRFMLDVGVGVVRQEAGPATTRRRLSLWVVTSDYHLYQVLGDPGIGLGDDGDPRTLRREFGSANEGRFFAVFFKIQLGHRPPDALRRLLTLWWPLTTRRLYLCRFAAGSGAGDRGVGPAAGGPRPNPELGIEKPDGQPAARGCVRCRRIEEPET